MDKFGKRYLSHKEFSDYAKELDLLGNHMSEGLLEFLERRAIINPVARLRFPEEIARRSHLERHPTACVPNPIEPPDSARMSAARQLQQQIFFARWRRAFALEGRLHPLDDLSADHASFVTTTFDQASFVPWKNFSSTIETSNGKTVGDGGENTRTFYHYWQAFALAAFMRSGASVLYDHADKALSDALWQSEIPPDSRANTRITINIDGQHELTNIMQRAHLFDTIARFADYTQIALQKYADSVDRETRELPGELWQAHKDRCREIAKSTTKNAHLTPDEILEFARFQCAQWQSASRRGQAKLAEAYKRNIHCTLELYGHLTECSFEEVTEKVGRVGGSFAPILKTIFPDWLDEQRGAVEESLANWVVPATSGLGTTYLVSREDVSEFCRWLESKELYQLYWHFRRLLDLQAQDSPEVRTANASEAVSFANTIELLANTVIEELGQSARQPHLTLMSKLYVIVKKRAAHLEPMLIQHKKLTRTARGTLDQCLTAIDAVTTGGDEAPVVRAFLKLVAIRNEGSHLGLVHLNRKAIYATLSALSLASLLIWKLR